MSCKANDNIQMKHCQIQDRAHNRQLKQPTDQRSKSSRHGGTWVFSKLHGLQYYFPDNFIAKVSDFSLHQIVDSENFRFPFLYEN